MGTQATKGTSTLRKPRVQRAAGWCKADAVSRRIHPGAQP